jgi:hypothetical protein
MRLYLAIGHDTHQPAQIPPVRVQPRFYPDSCSLFTAMREHLVAVALKNLPMFSSETLLKPQGMEMTAKILAHLSK